MVNNIFINKDSYSYIKSGKKRIEGRLKRGRFKSLDIKKNDILTFSSFNDSCKVKIKDILEYNNILDYLTKENLQEIIPGIKDITSAYKHYTKFYCDKKLKKYKMIAIKFEIIE